MVPLYEYRKTINKLREKWVEELIFWKFQWDSVQKELKELRKFKSMQQEKDQMKNICQKLLGCRSPYPSYTIFIYEQMTLFKLKELKEGRPY